MNELQPIDPDDPSNTRFQPLNAHRPPTYPVGGSEIKSVVEEGLRALRVLFLSNDRSVESIYPMTVPLTGRPVNPSLNQLVLRATPVKNGIDPSSMFEKGVRQRGAARRPSRIVLLLFACREEDRQNLYSVATSWEGGVVGLRKYADDAWSIPQWFPSAIDSRREMTETMVEAAHGLSAYVRGESYYERGRQN